MVNFPTWIRDCDFHSPALLDLFLSSDVSICFTMAFFPLWYRNQVVVSISIDFPSNSQRDASFHRIAYDYSRADWDSLRDHLTDVPWEDISKLGASAAAREFCEWVQVGIDVYIPYRKYQVKPHSSRLFSVACAAPVAHRNHFFHLYQKDKSSASEIKFRRPVIVAKGFLKLPNLSMLIKQLLPRNLAPMTFGELLIVFSIKVNLLYLLYSKAWRCCLQYLIKRNCLLKTFLRTLILMTQVSLYLTQVSLYLISLLELIWNCIIFLCLPRWLRS